MAYEGTCRSCGEPIYWLFQEGGKPPKSGKVSRAPIEQKTVENGNITVDLTQGTYTIVPKGVKQHLNHFINCPDRKQWKKPTR